MMGVSRRRSAGAKVTDEEHAQLEAVAQARGLTLGEWCREVLLAQVEPWSATLPEKVILTEVLGLRMIVINLLSALGSGEPLTAEKTQTIIDWADREKIPTGVECLRGSFRTLGARPRNPTPSQNPCREARALATISTGRHRTFPQLSPVIYRFQKHAGQCMNNTVLRDQRWTR